MKVRSRLSVFQPITRLFSLNVKYFLIFLALFATYSYLSLDKHSDHNIYTYLSEIWADKAGYYIYLPAATIYQFNAHSFPDSVEKRLGEGFKLNYKDSVIENKYTCGLSILWSPFYAIAHTYAKLTSYEANGFTKPYYKFLNYAGAFYFAIATILLYLILRNNYTSRFNSVLAILAIVLGTNAYYYLVDENGMTHIYSFALTIYLYWFLNKFYNHPALLYAGVIGLIAGFLVLMRPTNLIILLLLVGFNAFNLSTVKDRLKLLFAPSHLWISALGFLVVWLPQLLYWQYAYDTFLFYSYQSEGFSNWNNPQIVNVLLNPLSGLIPNSPVVLLSLAGIIGQLVTERWNGVLVLSGFIMFTYLFASWHVWSFGCSLGQRSFIDFYLFLTFPIAHLLESFSLKSPIKWVLIVVIGFFIWYTLQLSYNYKDCFFGLIF